MPIKSIVRKAHVAWVNEVSHVCVSEGPHYSADRQVASDGKNAETNQEMLLYKFFPSKFVKEANRPIYMNMRQMNTKF
jgi:hypothetical protein